ncbi:MAG: GNAT family N-acetyltransferase [Meiothermus sp.]|nr:GNAT family N-acetyltransferase [Meiothermus sp.]
MSKIIRLPESEIPRAGEVLAGSFFHDPICVYMFPDEGERARLLPWHFTAFVRYGHLFGEVYSTAGRTDGVAVWLPPGEVEMSPDRVAQAGLDRAPEVLGTEPWERFNGVMGYLEQYHLQDVSPWHWYLPLIGVDASQQGRGLGAALLEPILKRAEAEGLPCYLETVEPGNLPFYTRRGFKVITQGLEPRSGIRFWTFRRDPVQGDEARP